MLFAGLRNPTANAVGGRQAPTSSLTSLLFAMGEQGLHECGIELLVWEGVIIEIVTDLLDDDLGIEGGKALHLRPGADHPRIDEIGRLASTLGGEVSEGEHITAHQELDELLLEKIQRTHLDSFSSLEQDFHHGGDGTAYRDGVNQLSLIDGQDRPVEIGHRSSAGTFHGQPGAHYI